MIEQGSPEWFDVRRGKVTGSRVADVLAKTKTGYSASRNNYMAELICERLTGATAQGYFSTEMQWGKDTEPQARAAYQFMTGRDVVEASFCVHAKILDFGASPDGLVGSDGLLEIKCPNTATHIEALISKAVPGKYVTQMQAQMACTGRLWCDYVSFDPRLPAAMQMFVKRVPRDVAMIDDMEKEIGKFLAELGGKLQLLSREYLEAA